MRSNQVALRSCLSTPLSRVRWILPHFKKKTSSSCSKIFLEKSFHLILCFCKWCHVLAEMRQKKISSSGKKMSFKHFSLLLPALRKQWKSEQWNKCNLVIIKKRRNFHINSFFADVVQMPFLSCRRKPVFFSTKYRKIQKNHQKPISLIQSIQSDKISYACWLFGCIRITIHQWKSRQILSSIVPDDDILFIHIINVFYFYTHNSVHSYLSWMCCQYFADLTNCF